MDNQVEVKMISLLEDLQKRMTYLEKKIDMLVNQSSEKPAQKRSYPQPSRGREQRYGDQRTSRFGTRGQRPNRPSERDRSDGDQPFHKKRKTFGTTPKNRPDKFSRGKPTGSFRKDKRQKGKRVRAAA